MYKIWGSFGTPFRLRVYVAAHAIPKVKNPLCDVGMLHRRCRQQTYKDKRGGVLKKKQNKNTFKMSYQLHRLPMLPDIVTWYNIVE